MSFTTSASAGSAKQEQKTMTDVITPQMPIQNRCIVNLAEAAPHFLGRVSPDNQGRE
jgi:hypothetical protein